LCSELIEKSTALSKAVKNVDPNALILGPAEYGFWGYYSFQDAPEWWWGGLCWEYFWFIDYYLDQMHQAEITAGKRLLDVLDLHWYPETYGGGQRIPFSSPPYSRANVEARVQAPRTLWDPDYVEDSWITEQWDWRTQEYLYKECFPLLPKLFDSINTYYPGTKLAINEYCYGAEDHISGGIAAADVLGIFGKYGVYMAAYWRSSWDDPNVPYMNAAINMYRNYDGAGSTFGDTSVDAQTPDKVNSSIYASVFNGQDCQLHLIVINKSLGCAISGTFSINSPQNFTSARVWRFSSGTSNIREVLPSIKNITDNVFNCTIPPLTVTHIVLQAEECTEWDLVNNDNYVDIDDLDEFADRWLAPVGFVNFVDFASFAQEWGI
jgi:hypothetical protein